jgi:MoxR-like ATPase
MEYERKYFDPHGAGGTVLEDGAVAFRTPADDVYVYRDRIVLAVNVALATGRPLLIAGEPGSGKSTLARNVAAVLGWWYYKAMITSRTQANDLLWTFDALRRLNDAYDPNATLRSKQHYIEPGTLWWAFDPATAEQRGTQQLLEAEARARNPGTLGDSDYAAVVLLDEIDKADPDVPNDLLEPFDLGAFTVRETNDRVESKRRVLLMLTTNGERELPPAFMRRCVTLVLDEPDEDWFVRIAEQRFGAGDADLHRDVARHVMTLRQKAEQLGVREPSTGEYLDALTACKDLGVGTGGDAWSQFVRTVLWKHEVPAEQAAEAGAA